MSVLRSAACSADLLALAATPGRALEITATTYEGRAHLMVRTERATWLYDRAGGGFSRLVDREGRDWINFGAEQRFGHRGEPDVTVHEIHVAPPETPSDPAPTALGEG